MRVVVTGGGGLVGRYTIQELLTHGYEVRVVDVAVPPSQPLEDTDLFWQVDTTDAGQLFSAFEGAGAVIHLAAFTSAYGHAPHTIYSKNVTSTYNVLEVSRALGIRHVAMASSISAIGWGFSRKPIKPRYLPIDENHPPTPEDCYGLSKLVGEVTADAFSRLDPRMTLASLRFHRVTPPERYQVWASKPVSAPKTLWGYVDVRDVASSCRLAIEANYKGHEAFFIVAPDTGSSIPTSELVSANFPNVPMRKRVHGFSGLFDCGKARKLLGWSARYSWRTAAR